MHYLRHLGLGGTEKTCQLFFEHATRSEFEVAIAFEKSGQHDRLEEFKRGAQVSGGKFFMVDSYPQGKEPNHNSLSAAIAMYKPDILHVYRSGYSEFPEPGVHVSVPHFIETNVFGHYDNNSQVDRSLFMSKWLMDSTLRRLLPIGRGLVRKRFDFVNNPVEKPFSNASLPIRERWGPSVTTVGRVGRPDNGIYNCLNVEAVRLLRLQGYDIRFIVVAPPSNMLNDLARYDIPFYAIEPTTNPLILSQAYNSMDIYAHARADGETFGVNIAEAMIHGLPVVTHIANPSFPGMGVFQAQTQLVDHGKTGWVVNNIPSEYADALKSLIDDKHMRMTMGQASITKAEQEFEVGVCVQKLEKIYREVMNEAR